MAGRSTGLLASRSLERRVPLRGKLNRELASCCIARLLVLATEDRHKPVITYIDSPAGSVPEALGIISTMNGVHSPVVTFCRGPIGLAGALIAAHGLKGFRSAHPAARFHLQLDAETAKDEHESYLKLLAQTLAQDTNNSEDQVMRWLAEGTQFSAPEAVRHGLIDIVAGEPLLPRHTAPSSNSSESPPRPSKR